MKPHGVISAVEWENQLLTFLRVELAPSPGRVRATARIVVACLVTTTLVMAWHSPHASFAIISIFIVSQINSGASLRKALLRLIGTTLGAAVGMAAYVAFLDRPWLRVALLGPIAAFFIFLSRTTTAPDIGLLGGVTAVILMTVTGVDVEAGVHIGLWRFAMVSLGVVIATAAQLFLWPDDPEDQLRSALGERLAAVEALVADVCVGCRPNAAQLDALVLTGLSRQLDLLDQAEARYPSLRLRHVEQVALIAGIEQLLTTAVAFRRVSAAGDLASPVAPVRARLNAIGAGCARLRQTLTSRQPAAPAADSGSLPSDARVAESGGAHLLPTLLEMERSLSSLPAMTGLLDPQRPGGPLPPPGSVLDPPSRGAFITPAFSLANTEAIWFSLRSGSAATLAYVIYEGLAWPGLSTAVWTTLLVAQSTAGASVQKALLRLAGAMLGGALGLFAILWAMPNIDSLPPLLVVTAACTAVAAWIATGSSRIAYAGIQTGQAIALCLLNDLGPTTDLVPARDRVIGILLGVVASGLVFELTGSVHARTEMRRSLATTLRSLAGLSRVGIRRRSVPMLVPARGWRWKVYQDLAATLRLHDESKFEWGAGLPDAQAERACVARLTADAQAAFLALLAVVRHRLDVHLASMPHAVQAKLIALAEGVATWFEALASRVEGRAEPVPPALAPLLAQADDAVRTALPGLDATLRTHLPGRLAVYRALVAAIARFDHDAGPPVRYARAGFAPSPASG